MVGFIILVYGIGMSAVGALLLVLAYFVFRSGLKAGACLTMGIAAVLFCIAVFCLLVGIGYLSKF